MAKLNIERSISIGAPPEKVFAVVRDFRQWQAWSPWLIAEPGCQVAYGDDGGSYRWDGQIVGSGEMTVTAESSPHAIDHRLTFFKPWKSVSAVAFRFSEDTGGTRVVWTMNGSLPVFLFWMKSMMTALVGMDYQRGLTMLKDYVERGSVPSRLDFAGRRPFDGFPYLGVRSRCATSEIGPRMEDALANLRNGLETGGLSPSGSPFAVYHRWNVVKGDCEFTLGFPVATSTPVSPEGLVAGVMPDCETFVIRHTGAYRHLGNAWAAGMMHGRAKVFTQSRSVHPFEVYETAPGDVPENEAVTAIHFPLR